MLPEIHNGICISKDSLGEKCDGFAKSEICNQCKCYCVKQDKFIDEHPASPLKQIEKVCESLQFFLEEKNNRYGNSAINPVNVFSSLSINDSISVRIDDKISRIKNSDKLRKNDVVDLMGYLALLCISGGWTDFNDLLD